jgi:branched-chain amino acid transport system ATP-binding protein
MPKEILLKLENIAVHYGGVKALDGVSVEIDEGEIVALMGPNGAGKSTVLKAMFGLAPLAHGTVYFEGDKVKPIPYEMVERGIAFVPQGRRVFTHLTVAENLEIGAYAVKSRSEIKRRIEDMMKFFPVLREKKDQKSGTLSGGQQQMLAIARGLMTDPRLLLLDEPSLGLSPKLVKEVFAKIKEINEMRKMAIVVVEHNIKSLLSVADRGYVLDRGKVVAHEPAKVLEKSDILEKVFMGQL